MSHWPTVVAIPRFIAGTIAPTNKPDVVIYSIRDKQYHGDRIVEVLDSRNEVVTLFYKLNDGKEISITPNFKNQTEEALYAAINSPAYIFSGSNHPAKIEARNLPIKEKTVRPVPDWGTSLHDLSTDF